MSDYDHDALGNAIVRRLSELYVEERHRAHINARGGSRASPSAAFLANAANADVPKLNKDPVKNVRPACSVCGKGNHTESSCFHNEEATCPIAIRRAPFGTPLYNKHHPGSQPPPRNGGRRKSANSGSARALAASSSTTSDRECEQALADTLGRCGLLAEDCGGRALMAVAASAPTRPAAQYTSHPKATPTFSLTESGTATSGILDHLAEHQSPLSDLIQPYAYAAARVLGAIRQSPSPLTAIMHPMHTARCSLVKATSICRRMVGHLLPTSSRRDALLDDDASSATPQRQGAPQASHAFAATATAKPPPGFVILGPR